MGKTLYLECQAGISGDMTVAALLDLGADEQALRKALASLPLTGFEIQIGRALKSGIDCCDFSVHLDREHDNHDHDMQYLHGNDSSYMREHRHEHSHFPAHEDAHEHGHSPAHEDVHDHGDAQMQESSRDPHGSHTHEQEQAHCHAHEHAHSHSHAHRSMAEIRHIIDQGQMTERARTLAFRIFDILVEAEAKAHAVSPEQVHFHEVGAVDSIVDIVAAAVCLDSLDITEVIVPKLCEGKGTVRCQHGVLPIPVPAVANILSAYAIPVEWIDVQGEFVTPTGAAIAAAIRTKEKLPKNVIIDKIGLGAGKRTYERPSILRAMLLRQERESTAAAGKQESADAIKKQACADAIKKQEDDDIVDRQACADAVPISERTDTIYKLESNIDDCSGEALGYAMEQLFKAGARDVHYHPVFMKKNRPAWQLNVICDEADIERLQEIIFRETTTIGIRRIRMERTILRREIEDVDTRYGTVKVKLCDTGEGKRAYPEYDSVAMLCERKSLPFWEVYQAAASQAIGREIL